MDTSMKSSIVRGAAAIALAGLVLLFARAAGAAPCAGFTDVDTSDPVQAGFCPSVEWIKNRNVTTGCGGGLYCPDPPVIRLHMAAFMKRLGEALTPVLLETGQGPGAVDLDANVVVCQTADLAVAGFPRTAYADATLGATAAADLSFAADLVFSMNGGATWTPLHPTANRGSVPANQWGSVSDLGSKTLDVGDNVRFGARLTRGGASGTADLADSRCQIRVLVYSRTGAASPF